MSSTSRAPRRQPRPSPIHDEIQALASAGKIRKELIHERDDGTEDLSEAHALVMATISDAKRWGSYYDRRRRGAPAVAARRKQLGCAIERMADRLDKFVREHGASIAQSVDHLAPAEHPLSPTSAEESLRDIAALSERMDLMSRAFAEPLPGHLGRKSDFWLLGFVWGMAVGWRQLTAAPVSPRGRFPRFLAAGLAQVDPTLPGPGWEPLVKTAIERFAMRSKKWLRPGDDLTHHR